jgi:3-oxoadipate enol-lactonase
MREAVLIAAPLGAPSHLVAQAVVPSMACIPCEHPGHDGTEPLPAGSDMSAFGRHLLACAANAGEQVAVVGFGFGGMVALAAALAAPERISRMVLVCTSCAPGAADAWRERARAVRQMGLASLAAAIVSRWVTPGHLASEPDTLSGLSAALMTCSDEGYAGACEAIAGFDVSAQAAGIGTPALVIGASEDVGVPPEHGRRLAELLPNAYYREISGAGHLPFLDRPVLVNQLVSEGLEGAVV